MSARSLPLLALACLLACRAEAPPGEAPAGEPVAYLDGVPITRGDVSAPAAFRIYRHELDIYSLLRSETEKLVDARLLARAAEERGVSVEALLAEITSEVEPIDEAEVDRYLREHPGESRAAEAELRSRVRHYLSEKRRIARRLAFVEALRERAGYEWVLVPPVQPRTAIDIAGAPARGAADAPVTIVHFATPGSRHSAASAERIARLRKEFPRALREVYRNHLDQASEGSLLAARVGLVAQDAGRFWEFHDALVTEGAVEDEAAIARSAIAAGLGEGAIELARSDTALLDRVRRDMEASAAAGVPRAPTVFVNGRYVSGLLRYEDLRALVTEELAAASDGS